MVCAPDHGAYVEAAVRSALEPEGLPGGALEVIVVYDGSMDETPAILASFVTRSRCCVSATRVRPSRDEPRGRARPRPSGFLQRVG